MSAHRFGSAPDQGSAWKDTLLVSMPLEVVTCPAGGARWQAAIPGVAGEAAWLINPEDTDELVTALVDFTRDDDRRAEFSRRGRLRAAQFSWAEAAEKTWQVYRELAAGRP